MNDFLVVVTMDPITELTVEQAATRMNISSSDLYKRIQTSKIWREAFSKKGRVMITTPLFIAEAQRKAKEITHEST